MERTSKIYVAGHTGLLGSALMKQLKMQHYSNIVTKKPEELDLRNQQAVNTFFEKHKPEYVFLVAARVGGIRDYIDKPAEFMYENLAIQTNVMHAAYQAGVKKLIFFASACIYSEQCAQPIKEKDLCAHPLDTESEYYALPKLAGIKMCQAYNKQYGTNFISTIPVNLYGSYTIATAQGVIPSLVRRFADAAQNGTRSVSVWGSGQQRREMLHVDDMASASIFLMNTYRGNQPVNVGCGIDFSIKDVAEMIAEIVGYKGKIIYDTTQPEGAQQKLLDVSLLTKLGWKHKISLIDGLQEVVHALYHYHASQPTKEVEPVIL